ncbi:MAG: hypothetical protein IPM34_14200 [Saprospiraceae bacterium]|nr:hypothetical protein [Saprospiraceae bacterium]
MAQGCSDAGFCTLQSFQPGQTAEGSASKNRIKIGVSTGQADESISVLGSHFEYGRQLGDRLNLDVKLTSIGQNGNDISVYGLSDVFLSSQYLINDNFNMSLGVKLPLSKADKKEDGFSLPLDYQSSLGTLDLIFGLSSRIKKIQWSAGLQMPLSQNENDFLAESLDSSNILRMFQSTRSFKRAADILLRISYPLKLSEKLNLTPGILPIYHLSNDKFTNASDVEQEIDGSGGLTLNANAHLEYTITAKNSLLLNVGMPLVVRDERPDGLTRSFVANLEYQMRF